MVDDADRLKRGDRIIIRLPVVGRIEDGRLWLDVRTIDAAAGEVAEVAAAVGFPPGKNGNLPDNPRAIKSI